MPEKENDNLIETLDENGNTVIFKLFDIIEFEEKEYALLLPEEVDEKDEDAEIVIMRLIKDGEEYSFEEIDNDEEFEKVSEYIENIEDEE